MRLHWSRKALNSRLAIFQYIGSNNLDAAKRMDPLFENAARGLLQFPFKGKTRRVLGTRELLLHTNYTLVYSLDEGRLLIIDIIHATRQYP